jgi:HSP20 family protein
MANIMKKDGSGQQPATFSNVVDQIFQNNLSRFFDDDFWGSGGFQSRNQVPVNIRETDKTYDMEVIAPGLTKQDFKISLTGDMLTVSFDHKEENKQENKDGGGYIRSEYRRRSFSRSFSLGDNVDASKATARYEDGILHLSLPKKENAQPQSRSISVE